VRSPVVLPVHKPHPGSKTWGAAFGSMEVALRATVEDMYANKTAVDVI
jgi:hypothetical protein